MVKEYLAEFVQRGSTADRDAEAPENEEGVITEKPSYIDAERAESADSDHETSLNDGKLVHVGVPNWNHPNLTPLLISSQVLLSDMSAPWSQTSGFSSNTLSNPYRRMMNTSGMGFRDHAGSMVSSMSSRQEARST